MSTLESVDNPDTFPGALLMTFLLVALALVALALVVFVGLVRFGFELGCRYQAAQRYPDLAHTASSFRPALAWARKQTAYNRRRSVASLMFGR